MSYILTWSGIDPDYWKPQKTQKTGKKIFFFKKKKKMEENNNVSGDSVPMKKIGVCLTCHKHGRVFDVGCICPRFTDLNSDEPVTVITLHAAHYFCSSRCLKNWEHWGIG
jgi:hypothetical protein